MTGFTGPTGPTGQKGQQGVKGEKGEKGMTDSPGPLALPDKKDNKVLKDKKARRV